MVLERYPFKVGDFECLVINDDSDVYPLAGSVVNVSTERLEQALGELGLPTKEMGVGFNCLLINTPQCRILVDTGWGPGIGPRPGRLIQNLEAEGIAPQTIDTIILTHGDGDHVGGILDGQGNPAFPKARYVMWRTAWEFWTTESNLAPMPEDVAAFGRKTLPLIQDRLDLVEPETEFLPGFQLIPAVGHRRDHIALLIISAGEQLLHLADTVVHPMMLASPGWYSPYDSLPEQAIVTKRRLLDRAAADKTLVFAAHFPFPGLGYVSPKEEGWRWQPVIPPPQPSPASPLRA